MRFRAEQRLRRQQDFRTAREQGRRIDCGGFMFWYVRRVPILGPGNASPSVAAKKVPPSEAKPVARVGVVASTAAVGIAVERNRAKRRLREVFRRHQHRVPVDYDLLLVARHSLNRLPYVEIERKFVEACGRVFGAESK
jgi:ribonuclease P protein component